MHRWRRISEPVMLLFFSQSAALLLAREPLLEHVIHPLALADRAVGIAVQAVPFALVGDL